MRRTLAASRTRIEESRFVRIALAWRLGVTAACAISCAAVAAVAGAAGPDGYWSTLNWPPIRYGHSAVYDPGHDRMIVFGGHDGTGYSDRYWGPASLVWILTPSDPARWTGVLPGGSSPTRRYTHSGIFDSTRERMIVFGGFDGHMLNDTWELSLSGALAWAPLAASGTPPPVRHRHTAIYDPVRDRMIVYGGTNDTTMSGDVWELSLSGTPAWSEIAASGAGPAPRCRHSAIYDPVRERMIVFGGRGASSDFNDIWALDLRGAPLWSEIHPVIPLAHSRASHAAVYDPAGDRMIVYGGDGANRNDAWSLSLSGTPTWSLLPASGSPPAGHSGHAAILDPARNRVVIYGGKTDSSLATSDLDVLSLGTPAWSTIVKPLAPTAMAIHTSIYDPVGSRLVAFGGMTVFAGPINDAWGLSLDPAPLWSPIEPAGTLPARRHSHVAVYDRLRQRMVAYGGDSTSIWTVGFMDETWTLSLAGAPAWAKTPSIGVHPEAGGPTPHAVYDASRDRMVLILSPYLWAQSLSQLGQWQSLNIGSVKPPSSESPNIIYDPLRDRLILFGGCVSLGDPYNDVWAFSFQNMSWTMLPTLGPVPDGRCRYSSVYDPIRDRMLMIGGRGPLGYDSNEVWELTLTDPPTWRQLSFSDPRPPTLTWSTAVAIPERDWIVVEGGYTGSMATSGTWILEGGKPATPACRSVDGATWNANGTLTLRYVVSHPLESRRMLAWTLRSNRVWPGFPKHGCVIADAGAGDTVAVDVEAPDWAGAGTIHLTFGVSFAGADGAEAICTRDLHAPFAAVDVPALSGPAFLRVRPNPARRDMMASFSLPAPGRATLELFDIAGRRLNRRDLALGEGDHVMAVAPGRRLAPGVYVVQLSFDGSTLRARAAVVE
jgi:hypothetical protein